uniref:Uncharacterized protein n=1 Tax=Anguilla anguilla TaxID=7936 RepID=A0A0E9PW62_ANGAN
MYLVSYSMFHLAIVFLSPVPIFGHMWPEL